MLALKTSSERNVFLLYPMFDFSANQIMESIGSLYDDHGWGVGKDDSLVNRKEKESFDQHHSSPLYGEIMPAGLQHILDKNHMNAASATCLIDLGSGKGKLALQAFLTFPNLQWVTGIELSYERFKISKAAICKLYYLNQKYFALNEGKDFIQLVLLRDGKRKLTIFNGNFFDYEMLVRGADIILCETELRESNQSKFVQLVKNMRRDARLLMYDSLGSFPEMKHVMTVGNHQYGQLLNVKTKQTNVFLQEIKPHDRYRASWSEKAKFGIWKVLY